MLTPNGLKFFYQGPGLSKGPLPTLLYFALSGQKTLHEEPFNEPALLLKDLPMHILSCDLPYHSNDIEPQQSINQWYNELKAGHDFVTPFIDKCIEAIDFFINENVINPTYIGVAGLSRGGFIATHLAARDSRIKTILGFAPLSAFQDHDQKDTFVNSRLVEELSLRYIVKQLVGKSLRFYIGNRDTRVNTNDCYEFIRALTETSYESGIRTPPVELIIYPSIGHRGHGTPPPIFRSGALWIKEVLLSS